MTRLMFFCGLTIFVTWVLYYLNFGLDGSISQKTEVWGQFGDYVGGVVNPILSFISIYLLINSINLQREANKTLIEEIQRQEKLEEYKKFEIRLFNLIESQSSHFERFKIDLYNSIENEKDNVANDGEFEEESVTYKSADAVNYIDSSLSVLISEGIARDKIKHWLNEIDAHDNFFSIVRRFYLILKLIDDKINNEDKSEYYDILINSTDIKILILIIILCEYYDWDIVTHIKKSNILTRDGLREYGECIGKKN